MAKKLLITAGGTAQLLNENDIILWRSAEDERFMTEFEGPDFLDADDFDPILSYLVSTNRLKESESATVECEVEEIVEGDDGDDDDDFD